MEYWSDEIDHRSAEDGIDDPSRDHSLNKRSTTGGAAKVVVECVDTGGRIVWNRPEPWPFTDTDQGTLDPHAHIGMDPALLERIVRCRFTGTDPPLEGRLL
jgi:hypothetical protein